MTTKIVYTLVSSEKDIYLEQLWISVYSLRLHNPEAHVVVLMDDKTRDSLTGYRNVIKELADEILVVETPQDYTPKERSREIKTSIRKHINGDFLFIDTDTVICGRLDDIDAINDDIAIVPDFHIPFGEYPFKGYIIDIMKDIFNIDVTNVRDYFNSGAMFVKDTKTAHDFFVQWNKNWKHSAFNKRNSQDQPALMKTNHDFGNVIKELDGIYNCQIAASIKYLHEAKIIHFFNARFFGNTNYSPFFTKEFYIGVRETGVITEKHKSCITNCKSCFDTYTTPIGRKEFVFLSSSYGHRLMDIYTSNGILYKILNIFLKIRNKLII